MCDIIKYNLFVGFDPMRDHNTTSNRHLKFHLVTHRMIHTYEETQILRTL